MSRKERPLAPVNGPAPLPGYLGTDSNDRDYVSCRRLSVKVSWVRSNWPTDRVWLLWTAAATVCRSKPQYTIFSDEFSEVGLRDSARLR